MRAQPGWWEVLGLALDRSSNDDFRRRAVLVTLTSVVADVLTRRELSSICCQLDGHYLVAVFKSPAASSKDLVKGKR